MKSESYKYLWVSEVFLTESSGLVVSVSRPTEGVPWDPSEVYDQRTLLQRSFQWTRKRERKDLFTFFMSTGSSGSGDPFRIQRGFWHKLFLLNTGSWLHKNNTSSASRPIVPRDVRHNSPAPFNEFYYILRKEVLRTDKYLNPCPDNCLIARPFSF